MKLRSFTQFNEEKFNAIWSGLDDFIKYNPGARHRRRILFNLAQDISFRTVLDVGCGNGELLSLFWKRYPEVSLVGVDISKKVIEENQKRFSNIEFRRLEIQTDVLPQKFDLVVCAEVIEHLDDQKAAVRNLEKMMIPGGSMILTCPTGKIHETEKYFGHSHHPTVSEIVKYAHLVGLEVSKSINWGWPFYNLLKYVTNINPKFAHSQFGTLEYTPLKKLINNLIYSVNFFNIPSSPLGCQLFLILKKPTFSR